MQWIERKDASPPPGKQILAFTPSYREGMRFRVIDGNDFRILTDATHWTYISAPVDDQD